MVTGFSFEAHPNEPKLYIDSLNDGDTFIIKNGSAGHVYRAIYSSIITKDYDVYNAVDLCTGAPCRVLDHLPIRKIDCEINIKEVEL